ncbi:hypothetical protein, partial [Pseudomonas agarici]|uniref:hypothetical protein n=1 Tax=Pseudomonas agarici TaxID=46677 RepID=UPI001C434C3C
QADAGTCPLDVFLPFCWRCHLHLPFNQRSRLKAESGAAAEHFFDVDIAVGAGELHALVERLAQALGALKGEDVEQDVNAVNAECVPAMVEDRARWVEHVQASGRTKA